MCKRSVDVDIAPDKINSLNILKIQAIPTLFQSFREYLAIESRAKNSLAIIYTYWHSNTKLDSHENVWNEKIIITITIEFNTCFTIQSSLLALMALRMQSKDRSVETNCLYVFLLLNKIIANFFPTLIPFLFPTSSGMAYI